MEKRFNIIAPLKYSKTRITLITIVSVLFWISLIPIFGKFYPYLESHAIYVVLLFLFGVLVMIGKFIENNWLHDTKIIGELVINDNSIEFNNNSIEWSKIKDIELKKYIDRGYASFVSDWKVSYIMKFRTLEDNSFCIIVGKYAKNEKLIDFKKVLPEIMSINFNERKKLK